MVVAIAGALLWTTTGAADLPPPKTKWLGITTPGFTLTSNAPARKTRQLAKAFERFQVSLQLIKPGLPPGPPVPVSLFVFDNERDVIRLGLPHRAHVEWLRTSSFVPLERLFAVDVGSLDYNESARAGMFYAESWLLVHYLLNGAPGQGAAVSAFLARISAGEEPEAALRATLALDFADLERTLRGYVNSRTFPALRIPSKNLGEPAEVTPGRAAPISPLSSLQPSSVMTSRPRPTRQRPTRPLFREGLAPRMVRYGTVIDHADVVPFSKPSEKIPVKVAPTE